MKNEVLNTKLTKVAKCKETMEHQMSIGYVVTKFLAKKKIKMRRLLQRAHNIEDLSCLEGIDLEPTFSVSNREEKE